MSVEPIPPSIVKAICAVQTTMEAVKKSQRNQHGGYQFASTDDIYAALTRRMGEVGLALMSLEDECEIVRVERDGKTSQWARLVYSFVLATEDATWSDKRARRSLYIQVTGPQTFQAAQSYCEKSILRSLFKIPTGDMDLDSVAQGETEEEQAALNGRVKRKSSAEGKRDGSVKRFNELRARIVSADGPAELASIRRESAEEWATLPRAWAEILDEEYIVKMQGFGIDMTPEDLQPLAGE
jgi:hypothetical protein